MAQDNSQSFGKVIRSIRENAKKTLRDVADLLGISVVYLSDIERGRRNPPAEEKIKQIAVYFNYDYDELHALATQSLQRVELSLEDKTEPVTNMALVLARRWNTLSESAANEMLKIMNNETEVISDGNYQTMHSKTME